MTKTRKICIFLAFAALCWIAVAGWTFVNGRLGSSVDPIYGNVFNATLLEPDRTYDYTGETDDLDDSTIGAILPSPAANSALTARAMAALAERWSDKVILVVTFDRFTGPKAVTAWQDWQTPFGIVQVDGNSLVHLQEEGAITDNAVMTNNDAINGFMPYFSRYFPDKRVVPLIFNTAAGIDYAASYMDRLAARRDYFHVVMVTPPEDAALTVTDTEKLTALFDDAERRDLSGIVSPLDCCELRAMKKILQYDGADVLSVIGEGGSGEASFDDFAVFYGVK
ncbi:MAG: AmmeMemoRadiSam system protein B [Bacillota bacterium]